MTRAQGLRIAQRIAKRRHVAWTAYMPDTPKGMNEQEYYDGDMPRNGVCYEVENRHCYGCHVGFITVRPDGSTEVTLP